MPEYLSPGVYVEEISTGPKPIEGVSTSTAGFLGLAERGPEPPRFISSWLDFQRWYGGHNHDRSYLSYAIQGFFDNGGQRCFVTRILPGDAVATTGALGNLNVTAIGRGVWGNNIAIKVDDASNINVEAGRDWFRVSIIYYRDRPAVVVDPTSNEIEDITNPNRRVPDALEVYDNLTELDGTSNNVVKVINNNSRLVRVAWGPAGPARLPNQPLDDNSYLGEIGSDSASNGAVSVTDFQGDLNVIGGLEVLGRGRGLKALATIDEISLLLAPDEVRDGLDTLSGNVINQCELLKDRFAIVSATQSPGETQAITPTRDTSYAAYYYPWIRVYDPVSDGTTLIPPTGHIAGIFARTDIERGVHKAPANEVVRNALDMQFPVTKADQDILNPKGVNCIRDFRSDGRGIRLWGARTMSSDGEWKYVNVRRLFLFVEESIDEGTQWVVFEPNDEPTWAKVRRSITNFLISVWRSGALMGTTQDEAFFVKCDRTTMTQDDTDNGRLICYIGIAPVKPAEFVIFRISQKTAEAAA